MATTRVGVDLVRIADIAGSIEQFGDRYLQRIYTSRELRDSADGVGRPDAERLAARFAAKEAVVKVLRPAGHWFNWRQIEILRDAGGWVRLQLHGAAARQGHREGLQHYAVSLSHERDYAVATVIATGATAG